MKVTVKIFYNYVLVPDDRSLDYKMNEILNIYPWKFYILLNYILRTSRIYFEIYFLLLIYLEMRSWNPKIIDLPTPQKIE